MTFQIGTQAEWTTRLRGVILRGVVTDCRPWTPDEDRVTIRTIGGTYTVRSNRLTKIS